MSYASRQAQLPIGGYDRGLVVLYATLVLIGWLMIYTVGFEPERPFNVFDLGTSAGKQLLAIVVCFALTFVILMTDWAFWRTYALIIYLITIVLLPGTLIFGREINGNHAWYQFGGFSMQPAELAKFGTCLAVAAYLSSTGANLREWKSRFIVLGMLLLPILFIIMQKDAGSALIFSSFLLVMYREGLPGSWYALGFGTVALVILGLAFPPPYVAAGLMLIVSALLIGRFREGSRPWWLALVLLIPLSIWWPSCFSWFLEKSQIPAAAVPKPGLYLLVPHTLLLLAVFLRNYLGKNSLVQSELRTMLALLVAGVALVFSANFACYSLLAPHQQQRIKIWLKPAEAAADARGSAYNMIHSKMAIGSGGFLGKGMFEGNMTKLRYVPEQTTDYIFCTVGEEHGFVGVVSLIAFFTLLLWRITVVAERQRSNFSRIYAYCVAGVIFMHFVVNVGMTMGLIPTIGIPLPFISYGGSSLVGFTLMIAVLVKLDSNRGAA
ncbi:MAG TPA: rod shape-determining protein RodA [Saprospiraceae bacterium]|nr:rod shape-determining protein RodA [Saprospiraceae bacterium]